MLRSMKELFGYSVAATDGTIGKVEDFLFDEHTHDIRYLVVNTGGWLDRHPVLVAKVAFGRPHWPARDFPVKISREQVRLSPDLVPDAPPTRQQEADLHSHYEWLPYWLIHGHGTPTAHVPEIPARLCRARELMGFRVYGSDDAAGHLVDFILDEDDWAVRHLIAENEGWWPPRAQMVDMESFFKVDAVVEQVVLGLTAKQIGECPPYDPSAIGGREHEVLYDYQGRPYL